MQKLTKIQSDEIKELLKKAKSITDLCIILNLVQDYCLPKDVDTSKITTKSIKYFLYNKKGKEYHSFDIAKKSGGIRTISAPSPRLRYLQKLLNIVLQALYTPMPQAHGFIPERSIVTNARNHVGKKYVYNIDLKDFFPSISFERVWGVLEKLTQTKIDREIARVMATLCCKDGVLPQGAPTSPTLSNLVCIRLDKKFYFLGKDQSFTYTRYADDITISSDKPIFSDEFKNTIYGIIKKEGFDLNPSKERLQINNVITEDKHYRQQQSVTGIIVNKRLTISKSYIRNIEATIYNWEKYGYNVASMLHEHFYKYAKGALRYKGAIPSLENVVMGRIEYLGMVRGKDDLKYQYLKISFDSLCMKKEYTDEEFEEILDIWTQEGVEKAMNMFYDKRNLEPKRQSFLAQKENLSQHG